MINKFIRKSSPSDKSVEKLGLSQFIYRNKKAIATFSSIIAGIIISCIVLAIMGYNPIDMITFLLQGSFQTSDFM